jgi:GT2 family glycosyltransferase
MRFHVVIATIRQHLPGFDATMDRIKSTFDHPTHFELLDGKDGKAQALNEASESILAQTEAECYVTMDDDAVPGAGWQDEVERAFRALPDYGAFGLWVEERPEYLKAVGAHLLDPPSTVSGVSFRRVKPPHHLNGGFIAYRTEVARLVGKIPTEGVRYQLWEDAWRGRRVTKLGWKMAFLLGAKVEYVDYEDDPDYLKRKKEEFMFGKEVSERVLAESGLGDPLGMKLRKRLARWRGRAQ